MFARDVIATDLKALYTLIGEIYHSTDFMCQDFESRYPSLEALACEIAQPGFFVVEDGGMLVAYLAIARASEGKLRHTAHLNMGVRESARGKGVARLLVEHALAAVSKRGEIEIVYLHVRADNFAGVALYERLGFEKLCVLSKDTKIGTQYYDAVLMRKFLS